MKPFGGSGCRYLIDEPGHQCGKRKRTGSSYCGEHHALCYIPLLSRAERRRLREIDKIGQAVGGRRSPAGEMTEAFKRRIESIESHV